MNLLHGMPCYSVPDDDERWAGIAPGAFLSNGRAFFVRESEWGDFVAALDAANVTSISEPELLAAYRRSMH
jgi:hypothetical protein